MSRLIAKWTMALVFFIWSQKTFVTASTSRRKQQQELLVRAIAAEAIRRRDARRHFHLTTCPVLERAAIEPAFNKEHRDEGMDEGESDYMNVPSMLQHKTQELYLSLSEFLILLSPCLLRKPETW